MSVADQTIFIDRSEKIWFEFRDNNGTLIDVDFPRVDIENPSGSEFYSSVTMTKQTTGTYYYTLTIPAASSSALGLWRAWPHGWYSGEYVHPDEARYLNVIYRPLGDGYDYEFLQSTRRYIGDTDASDYRFQTKEVGLLIKDATESLMGDFIRYTGAALSYTVTADAQGVTFSSTPTRQIADLIKRKVMILVWRHYLNINMSQPGIINMGDVRISNVGQTKNIDQAIRQEIAAMDKEIVTLIMRGMGSKVVKTYDTGLEDTYTGTWRGGT